MLLKETSAGGGLRRQCIQRIIDSRHFPLDKKIGMEGWGEEDKYDRRILSSTAQHIQYD